MEKRQRFKEMRETYNLVIIHIGFADIDISIINMFTIYL